DLYGDPLPAHVLMRIGTVRFRHGGPITGIAWSPDGKMLATAGQDRTISLWDAETGKELVRGRCDAAVRCVAFSPDGTLLASGGGDGTVKLWDATPPKDGDGPDLRKPVHSFVLASEPV